MNTLPVTPSSARALAAARPGEVVVRVAMEPPIPADYELAEITPSGAAVFLPQPLDGRTLKARYSPAAVGERVAVECPACTDGEMYCGHVDGADLVATCGVCGGHGTLPATVTAAPEPERWCDGCEGRGKVTDRGTERLGSGIQGWRRDKTCPTCNGTPSTWVWRVGITLEPQRPKE